MKRLPVPYENGTTTLDDERQLAWAQWGDPEGKPVFWFHGTPGGRHQLPVDAPEAAAEAGLRIITVERPGTGDSDPHQYHHVIEFADDLRQVADELGAERFAAVGLSGGGPFVLAAAYALAERMVCGVVLGGIGPTRGADAVISHTLLLVPAAPALRAVSGAVNAVASSVLNIARPLGKPLVDLFFALQPGDRAAMGRHDGHKLMLVEDLFDAAARGGIGSALDDLALFGTHWGFRLSKVAVPVTFYGGTADMIVPFAHARRQAARVPGAILHTRVGRGHFTGYTEVHDVIADIRSHWPEGAATASSPRRRAAPGTGNR